MPYFVGTYFPKTARYGMPGFPELLERAARFYRESKGEITRQNQSIADAFARMQPEQSPRATAHFLARSSRKRSARLKSSFDAAHGGFGGAPKFPHPTDLELLLRRYARTGDRHALHVAVFTLERMAEGGIYDQLGGGFCRYAVDATWTIPHFEKMLYDNGPLLRLYTEAWAATGTPLFARIVAQTAGWTMREMQSPEGGYYSSLDADSEHEEGKFYVWTPDEAARLLTPDEYAVAAAHYGLNGPANFENRYWHLRVAQPLEAVAASLERTVGRMRGPQGIGAPEAFRGARTACSSRPRREDPRELERAHDSRHGARRRRRSAAKIGSRRLAARSEFIRETMWRDDRLLATYKDGRAHLNAYLDDYAFLLDALLELIQADFHGGDVAFARTLADALLERFEDSAGGFFFTSHDHEPLIHRPKSGHDNATPSGNGVAAFALGRLGHLIGEGRYLDAARRCVAAFDPAMRSYPGGYGVLLTALEEQLAPPTVCVLRAEKPALQSWLREFAPEFRPGDIIVGVPNGEDNLPPVLDKPVAADRVNAYVCRGVTCLEPVSNLRALSRLLADPGIE